MSKPTRVMGRDEESEQDWSFDTHTGLLTIGCQTHSVADWRHSQTVDHIVREFAGISETCTADDCRTCTDAPEAYSKIRSRLMAILDLVEGVGHQRVHVTL